MINIFYVHDGGMTLGHTSKGGKPYYPVYCICCIRQKPVGQIGAFVIVGIWYVTGRPNPEDTYDVARVGNEPDPSVKLSPSTTPSSPVTFDNNRSGKKLQLW